MNRAMEFLRMAHDSFPLLHDRWGWKAKQYVDLAINEVQALLDRIAELEAQQISPSAQVRVIEVEPISHKGQGGLQCLLESI